MSRQQKCRWHVERRLVLETLEIRATPAHFFPSAGAADGTSSSLREAISQADANGVDDVIQLGSGVYALTLAGAGDDLNQSGDLDVAGAGQTLTIRGVGASASWIRADVIDRVAHVLPGAHLILEDLTITHGRAGSENGGGVLNAGTLELRRVEVVDNFARFGGGVHNLGALTLDSSTFSQNFAVQGAGINNEGTLEAFNSTISGNNAGLASAPPELEMVSVAGGFSEGLAIENADDGSNRLFVAEQAGTIDIIQNGARLPTPFLNIASRVESGGEKGLLGLAFHPDYAEAGAAGEGKFYVYYSRDFNAAGVEHRSRISEFQVTPGNPNVADPASERILLEFDQPFSNHNGGDLKFGPDDGYLYISTGDGGAGGDPQNNAQNRGTLLGKILRIDVAGADGSTGEYGIPPDNPFVGQPGVREEIYAYGLRNPFRMGFDDGPLGPLSDDRLFVGDVGQGSWEEVDLVTSGGNYGWKCREGTHVFATCNPLPPDMIDPITEYENDELGISVIGGRVYRGSQYPELTETYIFSDFNGRLFTLRETSSGWIRAQPEVENGNRFPSFIRAFGADEAGEVYFTTGDTVYQVTAQADAELQRGGGIFSSGSATLDHVTVANNRASDLAGGVIGSGQITIHNTIIADNTAPVRPDIDGSITSAGYNLVEAPAGAVISGNQTGVVTGVDPDLGPLADNGGATRTHAPGGGSPALNAGDPGNFQPVDQLGTTRAAPDLGAVEAVVTSATVAVNAARDNTLFDDGSGSISNGAGQHLFAGRVGGIGGGAIRRGLLAFDVAAMVPEGATITGATLTLNMSKSISGNQSVALHRTLADWGEGASNASGDEGMGAAAAPGDATWQHKFAPSLFWTTQGGDFAALASATTVVGGVGGYQWSSPDLVADVQAWLDNPANNFGWVLRGDESTTTTAKRFDTRENPTPANRPLLTIEYTLAASQGVVDRRLFYNHAAGFDLDPIDPTGNDSAAIATDKQALLPGQSATFANYSSYNRGINGIVIDVGRLAQTIRIDRDDFDFRVGNDDDPSGWDPAPEPSSIRLLPAATIDASDRIVITFPDDAIRNQWLQVTLKANEATGLTADDVFYFGNAVAETGNAAGDTQVNATDFSLVRNNPRTFVDPAAIDHRLDINRDRLVNATDLLIVRDNATNLDELLDLITPGGVAKPAASVVSADEPRLDTSFSTGISTGKLVDSQSPVRGRAAASSVAGGVLEQIATGADRDAAIFYMIEQMKRRAADRFTNGSGSEQADLESLISDILSSELREAPESNGSVQKP